MSKRSGDDLFQLISSLSKAEKRNFKLYIRRNSSTGADLKISEIFDKIDRSTDGMPSSESLSGKNIDKAQLPNLKVQLYKQILASLRVLNSGADVEMQLSEMLSSAKILYQRGLYYQSLKMLDKMKVLCRDTEQLSYLVQAITLEKTIETLHITRSFKTRSKDLAAESLQAHEMRLRVTKLSNLALNLYGWYIQNGFAKNEAEVQEVNSYFANHLPEDVAEAKGFYEKMYLYTCKMWLAYIKQDFLSYYRHTNHWVDIFYARPGMIENETGHFIKANHNLLNAHLHLRNFKAYRRDLERFEKFAEGKVAKKFENNRVQLFTYLSGARLNFLLATGDFPAALELIPQMEQEISSFGSYLDTHRVLLFNYRFATAYFGSGDTGKATSYLYKITHSPVSLREDIHCYARLLLLICHYESGEEYLTESSGRSALRFMAKMHSLNKAEQLIFRFIRHTFTISKKEMQKALGQLLEAMKNLSADPYASRTFIYLDIISWIESKIEGKPLADILKMKNLQSKHRAG